MTENNFDTSEVYDPRTTYLLLLEQEEAERLAKEKQETRARLRKEEEEKYLVEDNFFLRLLTSGQKNSTVHKTVGKCRAENQVSKSLPVKPQLKKDDYLVVKVTHIVSPSEFYACPLGHPKCTCLCPSIVNPTEWGGKRKTLDEIVMSREEDADPFTLTYFINWDINARKKIIVKASPKESTGNCCSQSEINSLQKYVGTQGLHDMINDLSNFLGTGCPMKRQSDSEYTVGKLVAVQVEFKRLDAELVLGLRKLNWLRGVIAEKLQKTTTYKIYLIDYGAMIETPTEHITTLPKQFEGNPPLVYRCKLFGTEQLGGVWTNEIIQSFKQMVKNRTCYMEVMRGFFSPIEFQTVGENPSYEVNLTIDSLKSITNIGKELENHPGVQHNYSLPQTVKPAGRKEWFKWISWNDRFLTKPEDKHGQLTNGESAVTKVVKVNSICKPFTIGRSVVYEDYKSPFHRMNFSTGALSVRGAMQNGN